MTTRFRTLIRLSIAAALASLWASAGCAKTADRSGNSNTNWLRTCNADEDCGALKCLCGVCTQACDNATCRAVDPLAACVTLAPSTVAAACESGSANAALCTTECASDGDCTKLNASLRCFGGACLGGSHRDIKEAGADVAARDARGDALAQDAPSEAGPPAFPAGPNASCRVTGPGRSDCGPDKESCCASPLVTGGTYYRSYDGVTFTDMGYPATVSNFRLDKYEVTVGRFRGFVDVVLAGWRPAPGTGKHTHLNGGRGLADAADEFEAGWQAPWSDHLGLTRTEWYSQLGGAPANWTPTPGPNEHRPIDSIDWYQAYAFCIWDGAFLPSEAEWNYAAAGGNEQRVLPWSSPPDSTAADCAHASYKFLSFDGGIDSGAYPFCTASILDVGALSPLGDGKWGQADLAGNAYEWALDWKGNYGVPCADCAFVTTTIPVSPTAERVERGGYVASTMTPPYSILTSERWGGHPDNKSSFFGARCARSP